MSANEFDKTIPSVKRKRNKLLMSKVLKQLEFYFSDTNLHKDRFMKEKVMSSASPTGNSVLVSTLMTFNKLKTMGATPEILKKCLSKSSMLKMDEDGISIVRINPIKEPTNVDGRTVYVENIPAHSNHDSLTEVFSQFGTVVYISLPRFKRTGDIKGFVFVEFESETGADRACNGDKSAMLPEVATAALLPKMNRAMAALARGKSREGDGGSGGGGGGESESNVAKKTDDGERGIGEASKKENGRMAALKEESFEVKEEEGSSSSLKRRRTMSEGEKEQLDVGHKEKKKRRAGRSRTTSVCLEDDHATTDGDDDDEGDKRDSVVESLKKGQKEMKKLKRKKTTSESSESSLTTKKRKPSVVEPAMAKVAAEASEAAEAAQASEAAAEASKPDTTVSAAAKRKRKDKKETRAGEENNGIPTTTAEPTDAKVEKKSKNRRKKVEKKKKSKSTLPPPPPTMRVMPKTKWLSLRNEYLVLQRRRMSALKQNIANVKIERNGTKESDSDGRDTNGGFESAMIEDAPEERTKPDKSDDKKTAAAAGVVVKTYEKVPGLIIKVESRSEDNPLPPRSLLKTSFEKEFLSPSDESLGNVRIAYMDMEEGLLIGHIRCENRESSSRVLELGLAGFDVSLLEGKEEDDYWEKVRLCRESRKKGGSKKNHRLKNGMKRLVDKATKGQNDDDVVSPKAHIRFDD